MWGNVKRWNSWKRCFPHFVTIIGFSLHIKVLNSVFIIYSRILVIHGNKNIVHRIHHIFQIHIHIIFISYYVYRFCCVNLNMPSYLKLKWNFLIILIVYMRTGHEPKIVCYLLWFVQTIIVWWIRNIFLSVFAYKELQKTQSK